MALYHDLSLFFETSRTIFSQIIEHNNLPDSIINESVRNDRGVPFLTLVWQTGDSLTKSIYIGVVDEPWEAIAEIEIKAWKDIESRKKKGGKPRKFRQITMEEIITLRGIEGYDRARTFRELSMALWQAYEVVSRLDLKDLKNEFERKDDDGDPGPIKLEDWLGE